MRSASRSIPEMNPPRGQPLPPPAAEIMKLLYSLEYGTALAAAKNVDVLNLLRNHKKAQ